MKDKQGMIEKREVKKDYINSYARMGTTKERRKQRIK